MATNEDHISDNQIATSLPCRSCDYNLIGLVVGDTCPECNTKIIKHDPNRGTERFTANALDSTAFLFIGLSAIVLFGWPFYAYFRGIEAIPMLAMWPVMIAIPLSLAYFSCGMYSKTAITFDWKEETVSFERCFRSNSYYLSILRKKYHSCSFIDILTVEEVHGRGNSQLRVLTSDGMAAIPDLIDRYHDVGHRLRELANKTDEVSRWRRSSTLTIAALVTVALVGIGSLVYFLWIDPV